LATGDSAGGATENLSQLTWGCLGMPRTMALGANYTWAATRPVDPRVSRISRVDQLTRSGIQPVDPVGLVGDPRACGPVDPGAPGRCLGMPGTVVLGATTPGTPCRPVDPVCLGRSRAVDLPAGLDQLTQGPLEGPPAGRSAGGAAEMSSTS
jgi:hypothetical protein